jgi:hypothetical protein
MKITRIIILCLTFVYTLVRYIGFGNVDMTQIPVFLLNKSLSMSSVIFLLIAAYHSSNNQITKSKFWGSSALFSALLHVLFSLSILSGAYFSKLFIADKLTWQGGLFILFGILAIFIFFIIKSSELDDTKRKKYFQLGTLFLLFHLFFLGFSDWLKIQDWHGFLPPISLLSFLILIAAEIFYLKQT